VPSRNACAWRGRRSKRKESSKRRLPARSRLWAPTIGHSLCGGSWRSMTERLNRVSASAVQEVHLLKFGRQFRDLESERLQFLLALAQLVFAGRG